MKVKRGKGKGEKEKKVKKMRKAKVITALSLTVVMLAAMTGIAAADPAEMDVDPNQFQLTPGGDNVTVSACVHSIYDPTHPRTFKAEVLDGGATTGSPFDITFYIQDEFGIWSGPGISSLMHSYTPGTGNSEVDLTVYVKAATGTENNVYEIKFIDVQSGNSDEARATVYGTAIPEFATLAIPMAIAILSGLFFLNHRKRREE